MSFGYSISDVLSLTQTAWNVVQNSRKACGEHDELTREVSSLHVVLKRFEHEAAKPESPINKPGDSYGEELEVIVDGCHRVLRILDQILVKYNALSEAERSGRRLWQKIKFGNGQMANLADYRSKVVYYTSALSLLLNMISVGTIGSVEKQMNDAGGDLKEIKEAVNGITAHLVAKAHSEGSVLTAYPDDDRAIWKELRRELIEDGFPSSVIGEHKHLIKAYIKELGARGLLDDAEPQAMSESTTRDSMSEDVSHSIPPRDARTASPQSRAMAAAGEKSSYTQTSTVTNPNPLPIPEAQSMIDLSSKLNLECDTESKVQLTEDGVIDARGVTSVIHTKEDPALTTHTERPHQLHYLETQPAERPNIQESTSSSYAPTQSSYARTYPRHSGDGWSASLESGSSKVEGAVQVTDLIHENDDSMPGNAFPGSPADMIKVVLNAWFNEYMLKSPHVNTLPPLSAFTTLRYLLLVLDTANIKAIGWTEELKACRACLIRQINLRLRDLEKRSQWLEKDHLCLLRCPCKLDASEKAKSIRDTERKLLNLSKENHGGAPLKISPSQLNAWNRFEISRALHRIWHDHHDRIAPLCIEWVKVWPTGNSQWDIVKSWELIRYINSMRKNKKDLEKLDLYGDVKFTACREQLMEDIKLMVSSLRLLKSRRGWKWETQNIPNKSISRRMCVDISWVKKTIVVSTGVKCRVCSTSKAQGAF